MLWEVPAPTGLCHPAALRHSLWGQAVVAGVLLKSGLCRERGSVHRHL